MLHMWCSAAARGSKAPLRERGAARGPPYRAQVPAPAPPAVPSEPPQAPVGQLACTHFELCSGCTLHSDLGSPQALAECRAYFQQHGLDYQLDAGAIHHWRHRARLAVRPGPGGGPVVGLFREGSHEVVAIPRCVAHHPAINHAASVVRACMVACGVAPYNESTGRGDLRYIQLTVLGGEGWVPATSAAVSAATPAAATVQVVLVWNSAREGPPPRRLQRLADAIWGQAGSASSQMAEGQEPAEWRGRQRRHAGDVGQQQQRQRDARPQLVHSVWANFQQGTTNTILGSEWRLLHGPELAWARLGGADICFTPGSFMQVNPGAMDRALQAIQLWVQPSSTIVDLHAGVGTIGLSLAATRSPRLVRCVEINPLAEAPFRNSAARLAAPYGKFSSSNSSRGKGSSSSSRLDRIDGCRRRSSEGMDASGAPPVLEYHVAAAGSNPGRWLTGAEVAVVDPPRKGLERELLQFLASASALAPHPQLRRLLYLSCGWPALVRDCTALVAGGQWRLAHASGFLFFPGTNHIESLVVFDRQGGDVESP